MSESTDPSAPLFEDEEVPSGEQSSTANGSGSGAETMRSDRDLVELAKGGDVRAFGTLVRKFQPRVFRLAAHMLRDRSEAEDVAQETFVRAFQAIARFDARCEPYTWIYRIAMNLCLNVLRSRKAKRGGVDASDPRIEAVLSDARPSASNPSDQLEERERYQALAEAIDSLSETLRVTLLLTAVEGLRHDEAAEVLGAPEGTISWRVHEARKKILAFLRERGHPIEGEPRE